MTIDEGAPKRDCFAYRTYNGRQWRDDFTGVCCNDKSPYVTDYKDDDESCDVMRRFNNG